MPGAVASQVTASFSTAIHPSRLRDGALAGFGGVVAVTGPGKTGPGKKEPTEGQDVPNRDAQATHHHAVSGAGSGSPRWRPLGASQSPLTVRNPLGPAGTAC